jgi:hypothetical protein
MLSHDPRRACGPLAQASVSVETSPQPAAKHGGEDGRVTQTAELVA